MLRSIPPAHVEKNLVETWLRQALGEQVTFRYKSLAEIDVQSFWALLVICAATCKIAGLSQPRVVANFDVVVKGLARQGRHP
jgi:hypothetical protein